MLPMDRRRIQEGRDHLTTCSSQSITDTRIWSVLITQHEWLNDKNGWKLLPVFLSWPQIHTPLWKELDEVQPSIHYVGGHQGSFEIPHYSYCSLVHRTVHFQRFVVFKDFFLIRNKRNNQDTTAHLLPLSLKQAYTDSSKHVWICVYLTEKQSITSS